MQQQLLVKAVLVASLESIQNIMARAREDFDRHSDASKKDRQKAISEYIAAMQKAEQSLFSLAEGVRQNVNDQTTVSNEFNRELFDKTLQLTREQIRERFAQQPNIFATVDLSLVLLSTNMNFNAHFLNLRTQCAVEDRMKGNPSCYGLDGNPNAKGNRECSHCPHKV